MASTATNTIEQLALREYKAGFETLVEQDIFPPGHRRGRRAGDLGQEGRARVAHRLASVRPSGTG